MGWRVNLGRMGREGFSEEDEEPAMNIGVRKIGTAYFVRVESLHRQWLEGW